MCEHYVARAAHPFRIDELWPFTRRLERFGIAGFGWGMSWLDRDGRLGHYRDVRAFADDPGTKRLGATETTSLLVHLRRPSKLSTLQLADTQPFLDPAGRFAFSHNGDLRETRRLRRRYQADGRIHGRADTEVGERWLEDEWSAVGGPAAALRCLHQTFGGQANLALLLPDGEALAYAGNTENPVVSFRLGRISIVSTAIYSIDRSVFRLVAPEARERRLVRPGGTVRIDRNGGIATAS
jgi:glutamine phosphoribosylpyrophosphate amidotransferase